MTTPSLPRNIQTNYLLGKECVKTNLSVHADSAVTRCVGHMQTNHYEATVAEVFNNATGKLHAVVRRTMLKGEDSIVIVYKNPN